MEKINDENKVILGLFFTCGVSLKIWDERGLLSREIALYNKLAEHVEKIFFFTYGDLSDKKYEKLLAQNIIIVPKPFRIQNKLYSFLLPFIHRGKIELCTILKTNQMDGSWTAVLSKLMFRKKLIVRTGYCWAISLKHLNIRLRYFFARLIETIAYTFADIAIVTSQRDFNWVRDVYNYHNVCMIKNYVDTGKFFHQNLKKKKKEICFVGRLSKEKNIFSLITALKNTGISISLIGDGIEKENLLNFAKKEKVTIQHYHFVQNDKLPALLNQFKVFVLPSYFEGNPKALLEAMACGLCVIGTNVEGIKEVIQNNKTGLLCGVDSNNLRSTILSTLNNELLMKSVGKNAVKFIVKHHSLEVISRTELALYCQLSKAKSL